MVKRDKLTTKVGREIDCNIVGFCDGIDDRKIIVYTTSDNEKELLASYYSFNGKNFILEEIQNDEEWNNLEVEFGKIEEYFRNNKNNV